MPPYNARLKAEKGVIGPGNSFLSGHKATRLREQPMGNKSLTKKELALIHEVTMSLHAIRDLDEMLQSVLHKIKMVFQIEGASIALHDAEASEFYFIKTIEPEKDGDTIRSDRMRFSDHVGVAGQVMRENRAIVVADASADDHFYQGIDLQEDFTTRSMICAPLKTRKGFIGVLYAINKVTGRFTETETRLMEILSGTIAIALENARLYGELKQSVTSLEMENQRLKSDAQTRFNLQGIVGSSPAMRRLFRLLDKVIGTPTSVLIHGETGTGKELIAKVIHYMGPLKEKPFVAENCGAFAENLLESELFGHVKGAYTGAIATKKGLFAMADGGTVFLDEISETSPPMQVKLLRVLQERQIRPVGSDQTIDINIRLIASTNLDLEDEVKQGRFRRDLFYRINVFPIQIPPLRQRREDIPLLATHFLTRYARQANRTITGFTPQAIDYLSRFDWPGNVRELENEIERAVTIAGKSDTVKVTHLSEKISAAARQALPNYVSNLHLKEATEQMERKMVTNALQQSTGNRSKAAGILGISRQGLLNKIERYKINV